jgi:hypothetical protein
LDIADLFTRIPSIGSVSMNKTAVLLALLGVFTPASVADEQVGIWMRFETSFRSDMAYENPLYDVERFVARFTSPTGRVKRINGFWDGGRDWKIRFCPDEKGTWTFETSCSDKQNKGLHGVTGSFRCVAHDSSLDIYTKGQIVRPKGCYYLTRADGTPFFWTACTAWNGALKSTEEEWETYLKHRVAHGYNVIQFVTTQWRGGDADAGGEVAFTGCGRIRINPKFYQRLDGKVDRINAHGLVAAPVLLWTLQWGDGRELSPGYTLPDNEAILLARYMVARYGGHHVVWILGGDGRYVDEYEQRWKNIGRGAFGDEHPGVVAQHPHGRSWIGKAYAEEDWLDVIGYQSSHSNAKGTVEWITKGPPARDWASIPAKPIINLEPNYEEIRFAITAEDVRNASYWSVLATPTAGITYGANGIWPWIREGDEILNHRHPPGVSTWRQSIDFPGSIQIGYLANFMRQLPWWQLKPAPELLAEQPGEDAFNQFISVSRTDDRRIVVVYTPARVTVKLFNPWNWSYGGRWFDPVKNEYMRAAITQHDGMVAAGSPRDGDMVLVLRRESR